MKRRAWLNRRKPPPRRTPMKRANRARKARLYAINFGEYADVIRGLPCDVCGKPGPSEPHHARTRGAGGSKRDLLPLCLRCHREAHDGNGISRERAMERAEHYWKTCGEGA